MRNWFKILALVAFVLSCFWCYFNFGFEPVIAAVVSLSALLGLWVTERFDESSSKVSQQQQGGNYSKNYQAARDIRVDEQKE